MMNKEEFGEPCSLARYLKEVSMSDAGDRTAQLAGALLYGLGYPQFTSQTPTLTTTVISVKYLAAAEQTDLITKATEACLNCPKLSYCKVGSAFNDSESNTSLAGFSLPNKV